VKILFSFKSLETGNSLSHTTIQKKNIHPTAITFSIKYYIIIIFFFQCALFPSHPIGALVFDWPFLLR